jgi:hypothetical protein
MMLLMVYWEDDILKDDELLKKNRIEYLMKNKKLERKGVPVLEPPAAVPTLETEKVVQLLEAQVQANHKQGQQIAALAQVLEQQQQLMKELISSNKEKQYQVIHKPVEEEVKNVVNKKIEFDLPVLEEALGPVIDITGIESQGEAGADKTTGTSVKNKAALLKKLKKQGG